MVLWRHSKTAEIIFIIYSIQVMTVIMKKRLNILIASVWFINGFICKVLNGVPRHQEIVAAITGSDHARFLTIWIGLSEIAMSVWIVSGVYLKYNAVIQIVLIAAMNALEFMLVPELLLWGKFNAFFALLFILLIFFNEFSANNLKLVLKR